MNITLHTHHPDIVQEATDNGYQTAQNNSRGKPRSARSTYSLN